MPLCFLKRRNNDRVADRLAIIANLCNYTIRLNTFKLEESQSRLGVCIFTIAIVNEDFSLLSLKIYNVPRKSHISKFDQLWAKGTYGLTTANSRRSRHPRIHMGSI